MLIEHDRVVDRLVHLEDMAEPFESPSSGNITRRRRKRSHSSPSRLHHPQTGISEGGNASLSAMKRTSQPKAASSQIIRSYQHDPSAPQAGVVVAYGGYIPQTQGFGTGFESQQQYANFHGYPTKVNTSRVYGIIHLRVAYECMFEMVCSSYNKRLQNSFSMV